MNTRRELNNLFQEMELSNLEASIYIWLLENRRSTGYKVAMKIGKPVANTYKALKSLEQKGAVVSDNTSGTVYYDSVPVDHFLNRKEEEFKLRKKRIIEESSRLDIQKSKNGIYELKSSSLVFEKAREMIKSAEHSLLIDSFPFPLATLKEVIRKKGSSNIDIFLKHYADEQLEGIRQISKTNSDIVLDELQGQWLIIVKDAVETLIAFFDRDGEEMLHSVWIQDSFLSLIQFSGSLLECTLSEILDKVYDDKGTEEYADNVPDVEEVPDINFSEVEE